MNTSTLLAVVGAAALTATVVFAQPAKDTKPATTPAQPASPSPTAKDPAPADHLLPKGWTQADMQACMEAGTPGEQHVFLAQEAGTWATKCTMWMGPDSEPMKSDGTSTVKPVMDGRFFSIEMKGEMPGMGPYNSFAIVGYDNVAQKFQSTWIDNHGTSMAIGTGDRSSDGKTMTWNYKYSCPITKKPTTLREVHTYHSKDSKTIEAFATDPKSGKEYKMMELQLTRTSAALPHTATPAVKTR